MLHLVLILVLLEKMERVDIINVMLREPYITLDISREDVEAFFTLNNKPDRAKILEKIVKQFKTPTVGQITVLLHGCA